MAFKTEKQRKAFFAKQGNVRASIAPCVVGLRKRGLSPWKKGGMRYEAIISPLGRVKRFRSREKAIAFGKKHNKVVYEVPTRIYAPPILR